MRIARHDPASDKGWHFGPWNSDVPVAVGYANAGIDEPHVHGDRWEIYLIARGTSVMRVEREDVELAPGDVIALAPGEAHTFLRGSPDYLHFVLHVPCAPGEQSGPAKAAVPRSRLGLET
jgi:mannose-6-phosphate isomerase-like protein (cupin superfamily)